jgi:hypothetical protein
MKSVSWKHLHFKHGLTVDEYEAMGYETGIGAKLKRPNLALKGRKFPGRTNSGQFPEGIEPWNKGKTDVYTYEQLKRISEGTKLKTPRGPNNHAWKGGISIRAKEWCKTVLERDDHVCQLCGRLPGSMRIHTHHIKPKRTHPELRYDVNNGITLCNSCHATTHQRPGFDLIAELDKRRDQS